MAILSQPLDQRIVRVVDGVGCGTLWCWRAVVLARCGGEWHMGDGHYTLRSHPVLA